MERFFAGSFDDAQLAGMVSQITDRVGGWVLSDRVGHEIQTTVDHFRGEVGERPRQRRGDGVGQVDQHSIQQPGRPYLHGDRVFGAAVDIGQSQPPLHDGEGVFNGLITNDKFCMTRIRQLVLTWWRRPLRLRRPVSEEAIYLQGEFTHRGGAYEAAMASAPTADGDSRGSTSVGPSLSAPSAVDPTQRAGGAP